MKVKTSELIGPALDWAVAKCQGFRIELNHVYTEGRRFDGWWQCGPGHWQQLCRYSTDWAQGGPIIEREGVNLAQEFGGSEGSFSRPTGWIARIYKPGGPINPTSYRGPTPLITAMRCYAASHLGPEVEVPDELLENQS